MKRRSIFHVVIILSVLLAGCMSFTGPDTQATDILTPTAEETTHETQETMTPTPNQTTSYAGTERGGMLRATLVTEPPENATVVAFNNTNISHPLLTAAVKNSYETGNYSTQVSPSEKKNILDDLSNVPAYNGTAEFGHYIQYRDRVIRIRVIQYG